MSPLGIIKQIRIGGQASEELILLCVQTNYGAVRLNPQALVTVKERETISLCPLTIVKQVQEGNGFMNLFSKVHLFMLLTHLEVIRILQAFSASLASAFERVLMYVYACI